MIDYSPFWETLRRSEENWYTLTTKYNMSNSTLHRLKHNKDVSTRTLNDLCRILHCNIQDIVTYIPSDEDQPLWQSFRQISWSAILTVIINFRLSAFRSIILHVHFVLTVFLCTSNKSRTFSSYFMVCMYFDQLYPREEIFLLFEVFTFPAVYRLLQLCKGFLQFQFFILANFIIY